MSKEKDLSQKNEETKKRRPLILSLEEQLQKPWERRSGRKRNRGMM